MDQENQEKSQESIWLKWWGYIGMRNWEKGREDSRLGEQLG